MTNNFFTAIFIYPYLFSKLVELVFQIYDNNLTFAKTRVLSTSNNNGMTASHSRIKWS